MSQNSIIVPVRIVLEKQPTSDFMDSRKSGLFNDKGEELLLINSPEPKPTFGNFNSIHFAHWTKNTDWDIFGQKITLVENQYTDELFLEQINIKTIDEAYAFLEKHDHYLFVLPELISSDGYSFDFSEGLLITRNEYLEVILSRVQSFRYMQAAYEALVDYSADVTDEEKARHAFKKCLDYFYSQHMTRVLGLSEDALSNPDIKFNGKEAFIMLDMRNQNKTNCLTLMECRKHINEKIKSETRGVSIEQCLDDFAFEYHCPTLSSAMYEKMLLSVFNKDEYRKCAKCSAYFKVDKHHPQTLCDNHMLARRRKRQNAKTKEKGEDMASWLDSE